MGGALLLGAGGGTALAADPPAVVPTTPVAPVAPSASSDLARRAYASAAFSQKALVRARRAAQVSKAVLRQARSGRLTPLVQDKAVARARAAVGKATRAQRSAAVLMDDTKDLPPQSRARLVAIVSRDTAARAMQLSRNALRWVQGAGTIIGRGGPEKPVVSPPPGLTPGTNPPSFSFDGGFDTGDFSQWADVERVAQDRIKLVTTPRRLGTYAALFEVRPGDSPSRSGERAEVARHFDGQEKEGDVFFYSFSFYLPSDWAQDQDGYRIPFQFHGVNNDLGGRSTYPPVALDFVPAARKANGQGAGGLWLELHGGDITRTNSPGGTMAEVLRQPIQTGVWHDLILQIKWHRSDGAVTVWHKLGDQHSWTQTTQVRSKPTLQFITSPFSVSKVYLRQGLYRKDAKRVDRIYEDATRRGTTFADVAYGL